MAKPHLRRGGRIRRLKCDKHIAARVLLIEGRAAERRPSPGTPCLPPVLLPPALLPSQRLPFRLLRCRKNFLHSRRKRKVWSDMGRCST
jgi:hypothetical protein